MLKRMLKMIGVGFGLLVVASLLMNGTPALAQLQPPTNTNQPAIAAALPQPPTGEQPDLVAEAPAAAVTVTFDLCVDEGSITMPDGAVIPIWGFSFRDTSTLQCINSPQLPGPELQDITVGDTVIVNLWGNGLSENTSILFPGQIDVTATGGTLEMFTNEAVPNGGGSSSPDPLVSYTFTADTPGTFLYESGTNIDKQVAMGLYGALIVDAAPNQAYGPSTAYDVEEVLLLSEIDPCLNTNNTHPRCAPNDFNNMLDYHPVYWLINGRAYPDTLAADDISSQPYSSEIAPAAGQKVLLRYLNAGAIHHTMSLLGLNQHIVGRNAFELGTGSFYDVYAETIAAGETVDAIVDTAGTEGRFPLFSRQFHITNNGDGPGGMMTFMDVGAPPADPDLLVTKAALNNPVTVGDLVTYTITVDNIGAAATSVAMTDTLPAELTFASADVGTCSEAGGLVTCDLLGIANGGSVNVTLVATATLAGAAVDNIVEVMPIGQTDSNTANNSVTETITINPVGATEADLMVTKSDVGFDPVLAGEPVSYLVTVTNSGPYTATNVVLEDTLPVGVLFASVTPGAPDCAEASGTVACDLGDIASGGSMDVTVMVTTTQGGLITNTVDVSSDTADPVVADNSTFEETTVTPVADLMVEKSGPATETIGNDITYQVTVTNNGPDEAENVVLVDTLPAEVSYVSNDASCLDIANCDLGNIANGGSVTVNIVAETVATGLITNTADVSSDTADTNTGNNSDFVETTVELPGPQTITLEVLTSSDDAYSEDGAHDLTGTWMWLGMAGDNTVSTSGWRFTNVPIPPGSTIDSAKMSLVKQDTETIQWQFNWYAATADPPGNTDTFSSGNAPGDRTPTINTELHDDNVTHDQDTRYELDEIKTVVQEVVSGGGWVSGNDLVILARAENLSPFARKQWFTYDSAPADAAELTITFGPPTAGLTYGVTVTPATDGQFDDPGVTVDYNLTVENTGNTPDIFDVIVSGNGWPTAAVPTTVGPLAAGAVANVTVSVDIPAGAAGGDFDEAIVTVTSRGDVGQDASSTLTTSANNVYGVVVTPETAVNSGQADSTVDYTLQVENTGNTADTFDVDISGNGWATTAVPDPVAVAAGANVDVTVSVTIPNTANPGDVDTATVTVTSVGDGSKSDDSTLTTTATAVLPTPQTITLTVGASSDDAYTEIVYDAGNVVNNHDLTGAGMWIGMSENNIGDQITTTSTSGWRFTNVPIPPGATIQSAKMSLVKKDSEWIPWQFNWYAASDAATFSPTNAPGHRTTLANSVARNDNSLHEENVRYELDEIKDVVQEVVSGSWASDDDLVILARAEGQQAWARKQWFTWDAPDVEGEDTAPQLVITFTVP